MQKSTLVGNKKLYIYMCVHIYISEDDFAPLLRFTYMVEITMVIIAKNKMRRDNVPPRDLYHSLYINI